MNYIIKASAISNVGKVRSLNQDNYYFKDFYLPEIHYSVDKKSYQTSTSNHQLFAVFDGMGGETSGEKASFLATLHLKRMFLENNHITPDWFSKYCNFTNQLIVDETKLRKYKHMGTTAVIMNLYQEEFQICTLGDSSIFCYREGQLERLNPLHDNSEILKKYNIQNQTPELTQFLGIDPQIMIIEPYYYQNKLKINDIYLLCSDGLAGILSIEEIKKTIENQNNIDDINEQLLNDVLIKGAPDNVTIIIIEIKREE